MTMVHLKDLQSTKLKWNCLSAGVGRAVVGHPSINLPRWSVAFIVSRIPVYKSMYKQGRKEVDVSFFGNQYT